MMPNNMLNNSFIGNYNAPNKVSKNVIIGGDFSTNPWQRGTTFTALANGAYAADRFKPIYVTSAITDYSQSSDAPTISQAGLLTNNSLMMSVTTADAVIAATDFYVIRQVIEGYTWSTIAQRPFTLSFWVKAVKTGTYCVAFRATSSVQQYVAEYTVNNTATWEFKTITVPASPAAGAWNYTTGTGIIVDFTIAAGSSFFGTANTWIAAAGAIESTSNQVNGLDSNANTFQLALIQLEAGTIATPFEIKTEQAVLAACQRYFWKTFPQGITPVQNVGNTIGALTYICQVAGIKANGQFLEFPECMRATPTITTYNPNAAANSWRNITVAANSGAASVLGAGNNGVFVSNAQVAGDLVGGTIAIHLTGAAEL